MKRLISFVLMLLVNGVALAQTPVAKPAPSASQSPHGAQPGIDQRIEQMHRRLKITPAQEPDWDAFTRVMRDNVTSAAQAYKERSASIATMSAPDNMRNFATIEQARAQAVQTLADSFQKLYDTFSDEQKQTADTMFRRYQDRGSAPAAATK